MGLERQSYYINESSIDIGDAVNAQSLSSWKMEVRSWKSEVRS